MGNKTLVIILGTLSIFGGLRAQGKIAFVDSEKVLEEFEDAKIARATLDQSVIQWRHELDSLRLIYQKAEEEFKVQQPMLSEEALRARQQELATMRRQPDAFAQDIWGEGAKVAQKRKELFTPVMEKINDVVEKIAEEQGIEVVLDISAGTVLYADVSMDITADVIEELNREYVASTPTPLKKKVAVFGIAALDQQTQSENLGSQTREIVIRTVQSFQTELNFDMIADVDIEQVHQQYGQLFDRQVPEETGLNMGATIGADFVYMGTVASEGGDIIVSLQLLEPPERKVLGTVTDRIPEREKTLLDQRVVDLVKQLQAYLITGTK